MLLAAMLAMVLVVASPALAQQNQTQRGAESGAGDLNQAQCQNFAGQGAGNFQYNAPGATGGDQTTVINQNCVANAGGAVEQINVQGGGGVVKKTGGDVKVVSGGEDFKSVGVSVVEGKEVPVFVDEKGAFFTLMQDEVVLVEKPAVTFFTTDTVKKAVTGVQYQYAGAVQYQYAGAAQYQYGAKVAPLDITVLPDTGGASLITLGAGALLVAGGLLARRIVR